MFKRNKTKHAMQLWEYHEQQWQERGCTVGSLDRYVAITVRRLNHYEAVVHEWRLDVLREKERVRRHEPQRNVELMFDFGEPAYICAKEAVNVKDPAKRYRAAVAIAREEIASLSRAAEVPVLSWMMQDDEYLASSVSLEQYNTLIDFRTLKDGAADQHDDEGPDNGKWLERVSAWDPVHVHCARPIPSLVCQMSERDRLSVSEVVERLSFAVLLGGNGSEPRANRSVYDAYRDEVRDRAVRRMMERNGLVLPEQFSDLPRAVYSWGEYRIDRQPDINAPGLVQTLSPHVP